jgi:colicin import membrane protein
MSISPAIRARIFNACDELYNAGGRTEFPTVDSVRRLAKVSMNDCCIGVKEWRKQQTSAPKPMGKPVPDQVQQASTSATAQLWAAAVEIAQGSLNAASAGWDQDRTDNEKLLQEACTSFERECAASESLRARLAEIEANANEAAASAEAEIAVARGAIAVLTEQASTATTRAGEIEKRADDLKSALTDAQASARTQAANLDIERRQHAEARALLENRSAELATAKARLEVEQRVQLEQAEQLKQVEADLANAAGAAASAREEGARLKGMCETLQANQAELMSAIKQLGGKRGAAAKRKKGGEAPA